MRLLVIEDERDLCEDIAKKLRKGHNNAEAQNRRPALPAGSRHCNDRVRPVERRSRYGIIKGDPPVYGVCWDWIREIFRF